MGVPANEVILGTVHINGGTKGFSERVCLLAHNALNQAAADTHNLIARGRAVLMSDGFSMEWAKITAADLMRNRKASIITQLAPLGDGSNDATTQGFGVCNNIQNALLFSGETAEGKFASEHVRAIPDQQISDDLFTQAFAEINPPVAVPTAFVAGAAPAGTWWLDQLKNYLALLRVHTCHLRALPDGTYEKTPWEKFIYRRVSNLYTGRPFDTSLRSL